MLAHHQDGLLNAADFARGLGIDGKTVASYLDLLVDLLLVRRQPLGAAPPGTEPSFYRTSADAEIDLLLPSPSVASRPSRSSEGRERIPSCLRGFEAGAQNHRLSGHRTFPAGPQHRGNGPHDRSSKAFHDLTSARFCGDRSHSAMPTDRRRFDGEISEQAGTA
jgi:hypothetical protein